MTKRLPVENLAEYQLIRFYKKGKFIEEIENEWFRRYAKPYPFV